MKAWIGAGLVALSALLIPATGAAAPPASYEIPGATQATFSLPGTNGFRISVSSYGRQVYVQASKGGRSAVAYLPRGRHAEGGDIDLTLPGVARIAVEFQPRGRVKTIKAFTGCKGRPAQVQRGVFVGTIRFDGERGYTHARSHRAKGRLTRTFDETCTGGGEGRQGREPDWFTFFSTARRGRTQVSFTAAKIEDGSPFSAVLFFASAWTSHPRMAVYRSTSAILEKPRGFDIADPAKLDSAVLTPPKPFSGSATYSLNPDGSGSWTGSLSADIPGLGPVALAGPRFESGLCRQRHCTGDDLFGSGERTSFAVVSETATSARRGWLLGRPVLLQESGSHSQALADVRLSWSR